MVLENALNWWTQDLQSWVHLVPTSDPHFCHHQRGGRLRSGPKVDKYVKINQEFSLKLAAYHPCKNKVTCKIAGKIQLPLIGVCHNAWVFRGFSEIWFGPEYLPNYQTIFEGKQVRGPIRPFERIKSKYSEIYSHYFGASTIRTSRL